LPEQPRDSDLTETLDRTLDKPRDTRPSNPSGASAPAAGGLGQGRRVSREEQGRYAIRDETGRGGMGRVLVAFDEFVGREVAFKELLGPIDPETTRRFLHEARITGQLEHPNIVPVYEVGQSQSGALYYTMRLVRGKTLSAALAECRTLAERLRHLGAFWNLCNAVAYAHGRGVVHRDLKPDNVMVGEFGETVLIDWGIASVGAGRPAAGPAPAPAPAPPPAGGGEPPQRPSQREAVGTPAYMSPEQTAGDDAFVDARSDVWGLGAVLYELLTGHPPFAARTVSDTLFLVREGPLVKVRSRCPEAPPELAAVAEKALQKRPADRYQSAIELAEEIRAYISGGRVRAYAYSSWELVRRFAAQNRALVSAAALALVAVLAALFAVSASLRSERAARRDSELHLARAYLERAQRHLDELDLDATERYAAASRLHNPASPESPSFDEGFARTSGPARTLDVEAATTLFQAEARKISELQRVLPASAMVGGVAFSGDGRTLASGDQDHGRIQIWDAATGEPRSSFPTPPAQIWTIALSADGSLLARGTKQYALDVWDVKTGRMRWAADPSMGAPRSLLFTGQGDVLASFERGAPRVYEAATGRILAELGPEHTQQAVALSGDGGTLAVADDDAVALFRFPSLTPAGRLLPKAGLMTNLAFAPDGRQLVASRLDRTLITIDVASPERVNVLKGHQEAIGELAYTGDGRRILSQSNDGVRLWDAATGQLLMVLRGENSDRCMAVSPDGARFATGGADEKVMVYGIVREPASRLFASHADSVTRTAFSRDGGRIVTGGAGRDPTVRIFDAATLAPLARLEGHASRIGCVAFHPDGARVASGSTDGSVRVWDWAKGTESFRVAVQEKPEDVAFSPDGTLLAESGTGGVVHLFDACTGAPVGALVGHTDTVGGLAFSPDGRRLASASNDRTVRLWDVATRKLERVLEGHREWAWGAAFSPDGRVVAAGGKDGDILLWDAASGAVLKRLSGHRKWVNQVGFGARGDTLVSCSDDGTVRVWDVASGEARMVYRTQAIVESVDLSPDGAWLLLNKGSAGELFPARLPKAARSPAEILRQSPLSDSAF
jgi:WD40 repeat protein/serine/threonine protein kinase